MCVRGRITKLLLLQILVLSVLLCCHSSQEHCWRVLVHDLCFIKKFQWLRKNGLICCSLIRHTQLHWVEWFCVVRVLLCLPFRFTLPLKQIVEIHVLKWYLNSSDLSVKQLHVDHKVKTFYRDFTQNVASAGQLSHSVAASRALFRSQMFVRSFTAPDKNPLAGNKVKAVFGSVLQPSARLKTCRRHLVHWSVDSHVWWRAGPGCLDHSHISPTLPGNNCRTWFHIMISQE